MGLFDFFGGGKAESAPSSGGNVGGEDVKVVARTDGKTDTYFGGDGKPDGPGHGHVVWNPDRGSASYVRESESHGGGVLHDDRK